ncbi:hypothetical protein E4U13_007072 [Claviceps humidiphila]|uniref:Uncharacterized protein n=1 Tax=Claviceps humidiphila TaxID=1294629 RepID=A0A9P7PVK1_9HYPO|nr:hypothetical protein E4U13_007072 [Claviceps humidiphila]
MSAKDIMSGLSTEMAGLQIVTDEIHARTRTRHLGGLVRDFQVSVSKVRRGVYITATVVDFALFESTLQDQFELILNGGSEVICLVDDLSKESVLSHEDCRVSKEGTVHGLNEITWADILVAIDVATRPSELLHAASNSY